jgi:unsaturated rhamnogalacturonyl hydrolase
MTKLRTAAAFACLVFVQSPCMLLARAQQLTTKDKAPIGDAPANPGPLATGLSPTTTPKPVKAAMRKVADWQVARVEATPSRDWTYAALYDGLLAASKTLHQPRYHDLVLHVAEGYNWTLGPRQQHADDQAIGQAYLALYREHPDPQRIQPMRTQFDAVMQLPDNPQKPVWWWCDALFMAPPVWAGLADVTHDAHYLDYMNREWQITSNLLWDPQEHLFFRDSSYFNKREKNGSKIFWSRGNGWVMAGLARTLDELPPGDPHRSFYTEKFQQMAAAVAAVQGSDGLWRPGLLDAAAYPYPENSGSGFFVYAFAWGIRHNLLDAAKYRPVVDRGWRGLVGHIYADGRLGDIQPVGAAPGVYAEDASYVYGVGAFLLAGSEIVELDAGVSRHKSHKR